MPILKIQSNQAVSDKESFMKETTSMLAEVLGKPPGYIMVIMEKADMTFAGDIEPTVYAELKSIGLPEDRTLEFSEVICEFIGQHLGVSKDRIYIEFTNTERHMLGWNGKTFAR